MKVDIDESWVILKGYLFYYDSALKNNLSQSTPTAPEFSTTDHLKGIWQKASTFENSQNLKEWFKLDREQWLCTHMKENSSHFLIDKQYKTPEITAEYYENINKNSKLQRLFVVPDSWI